MSLDAIEHGCRLITLDQHLKTHFPCFYLTDICSLLKSELRLGTGVFIVATIELLKHSQRYNLTSLSQFQCFAGYINFQQFSQ